MIAKSGIIPFFKLEKLKIEIYETRDRNGVNPESFEAMFNPESFTQSFTNHFSAPKIFGGVSDEVGFTSTSPRKLKFKLILDDTGVTSSFSFFALTLTERVEKFIKDAAYVDGDTHEPQFLRVKWGTYSLDCRIESLDVKYTLFDRGGNALRAELDIAFIEDVSEYIKQRETKMSSPDLTHVRVVKKGDTLPMMAKEIYGFSDYYIQVAQHNKLKNFRKLQPGMEISFPPLEK